MSDFTAPNPDPDMDVLRHVAGYGLAPHPFKVGPNQMCVWCGKALEDPLHDPSHDPVDMPHIAPPSEAEMALVEIGAMIADAAEELQQADETDPASASWTTTLHVHKASAQAQIAQAQASYAIALQLRELHDLLDAALSGIKSEIADIPLGS